MKEDKEYIIPLDEEATEKLSKQIIKHIDFKSVELQERIDKALIYIKENTQNDTQVDMFDYDKFDELVKILKGDE